MGIGASLRNYLEEVLQNRTPPSSAATGNSSRPYSCNTRLARLDFPRFNGDGIKNWITQCETFFSVDQTPEDYKVLLAVIHFEGKAPQWHSAYVKNVGIDKLPSWKDYTKILLERFGEVCEDPMAELMRLRQRAFSLAKMYENANATATTAKPFSRIPKLNPVTKPPLLPNPPKPVDNNKPKTQTTKQLTPAFMSERRAKGLCYFCDEPFTPEHSRTHKKLQIHVMELDDTSDSVDSEEVVDLDDDSTVDICLDPLISVNALTGVTKFNTMRVTGRSRKKPLHILIDSGSTHNFLDVNVAKRLGCKIEDMDSVTVTVADGARVQINTMVKGFSWLIQNTVFTSDIMLLPLGCCDMVLGIEWLITLGDITWNFDKLTIVFHAKVPKTLAAGVHLSMLQLCDSGDGMLLHSLSTHADPSSIPNSIEQLLLQYAYVFAVPTNLPPRRPNHDHTIPLIQGSNPVNKRPYRSKCYFGVTRVEYLGHFNTGKGVSTNPAKVEAVRNWPLPQTLKQLRGFLGLAGYYRQFVKGYNTIAKSLNNMLKKDGFT
uniref:Retrotransposon gag domain-containing protein n=1 Tax=Cajanus cajan TaxID=3821 RepID=A0A151QSM7_CAJCA|nr:hypothetical protein KK1_045838 [Cajanus cajan]